VRMRRPISISISFSILFVFVSFGVSLAQNADLEVARKAYEDGFYDVAEGILQKYTTSNLLYQDEARLLLAKVYAKEGRKRDALKILLEMRSLPDLETNVQMQVYETLISLYKEIGDIDSALQVADEMVEKKDEKLKSKGLELLSDLFFSKKDYDSAIAKLKDFIGQDVPRAVRQVARFKLAQAYYEAQDLDKAKELFEKFLYDFPESEYLSSAYFFLGKIYYILAHYQEAIKYFDKVALIYKGKKWGGYALQGKAWALLRMGRLKEAEDALKRAIDCLGKKNDSLEFAEGYLSFKKGEFQKAIEKFKSVLAKYPDTKWKPDICYWLAEALFRIGDYSDARSYYEKSISLLGLSRAVTSEDIMVNAYYGLAWTDIKLGRFEEAIQSFETISKLSQEEYAKLGALVNVGDVLMSMGSYEEAIKHFNKLLTEYPDSYYSDYILLQIGIAYMKLKKYDQGILYFKDAIKAYPSSRYITDLKYNLALAYFNAGDFDSTITILEGLKKDELDAKYQPHLDYVLATAYFNSKKFKPALHLFRKLLDRLEKKELKPELEYELAWCYYRLGRESEAIKRFRQLVERHPEDVLAEQVLLWLSEKFISEEKYTQAENYLKEYVGRYPNSSGVYKARYDLAWLYAMKGKDDEAIQLFEKYADDSKNPMQGEYKIALAYLFRQKGEYDKALELLRWVIKNKIGLSAKAYQELSEVYYRMGRLADSAYALEKVLEAVPEKEKGNYLYQIGTIWEEAGEMDKAVEFYLKAGYNSGVPLSIRSQSLLKAARIYERKGKLDKALKLYKKVKELGGPESKLAQEKLEEYKEVAR